MALYHRSPTAIRRRLHINHHVLRESMLDIDFHRISLPMAMRNTLGIGLPIIIATAMNHPELAIITGIGAFSVSFSDRPGPDLYKFPRMFATALMAATSVFVGVLLPNHSWWIALYAILLSGITAMLTVFGPSPTQSGATTLVAFFVASQFERSLPEAIFTAGLVVLVGLAQSLLAITVDPVRIPDSRGETCVSAYRSLARYINRPEDHRHEVPAAIQITASTRLVTTYDQSPGARESRHVVNSIQRLQSDVITLGLLSREATVVVDTATRNGLRHVAASALTAVGDRVTTGGGDPETLPELVAFEAMADVVVARVVADPSSTAMDQLVARRYQVLARELRKSLGWVEMYRTATRADHSVQTWLLAWRGRITGSIAMLRENLEWSSPYVRHALRQMFVIAISYAVYLGLDVPWGFWIPLTAVVVLRPDYGQTLSRGLGRIAGTLVGLAIGSLVMSILPGSDWWWVAAVIGFAFAVRVLNPTGFVMSAMAISAYVVALLHVRGLTPLDAFIDRSANTIVGGTIAMGVFLLWPTWEHIRARSVLAEVVRSYQRVFTMGLTSILRPGTFTDPELHAARNTARMARANAESFARRIRIEPGLTSDGLSAIIDLVIATQRMALHQLALEGYLRDIDPTTVPASLIAWVQRIEGDLGSALARIRGETLYRTGINDAAAAAVLADLDVSGADVTWLGVSMLVSEVDHDAVSIVDLAEVLASTGIGQYVEDATVDT